MSHIPSVSHWTVTTYQPSEATAEHRPSWSVGSYWTNRLSYATQTLVSHCKTPFLWQDVQWPWLVHKWIVCDYSWHCRLNKWLKKFDKRPHRRCRWTIQSYSLGGAKCVLICGHKFNHIRQVATWQIWLNLCFLRPSWVHNPNGKSIGSAVFAQLMAECRRVCWRHLANTIGLMLSSVQPSPQPKQQIDRFSCFCTAHGRKYSPYTLQWATLSPELPLPMGGSGPPSNTWFSKPTWVLNPNSISIGSAVFAVLTSVTDRQTTLLAR